MTILPKAFSNSFYDEESRGLDSSFKSSSYQVNSGYYSLGTISYSWDHDYYEFEVSAGYEYTITLTSDYKNYGWSKFINNSSLEFDVVDYFGFTQIESSSTGTYDDSLTISATESGTYYVDVHGFIIFGADYALGITETFSSTSTGTTTTTDITTEIVGASGADSLLGTSDANTMNGGDGADTMLGYSGADTMLGGKGNDLIYGNAGLDYMVGGSGDDTIYGGQNSGSQLTYGTGSTLAYREGTETMSGGAGNDLINGNHGSDVVIGGAGQDTVYGGQDADTLSGGDDVDYLYGNLGDDLMVGGEGWDRFYIQSSGGDDTITDFTRLNDWLYVESNINSSGIDTDPEVIAAATQSGSDVVIDFGSGNTVTLSNFTVANLSTADIVIF